MIRAVLFDVTGVLALPDARWIAARLSGLGVHADPARLDRAFYLAIAAYDRQQAKQSTGDGAAPPPAFATAYALGARLGAGHCREVEQVLLHTPVPLSRRIPLPGVESCLRQLSELGMGIGIVANSNDGQTAAWLRHWQLSPAGQAPAGGPVVTDSVVAGTRKPDPRIFAVTLARLGVSAAEALHVGDSLYLDVDGSRDAGLQCVHFDPYRLCTRTDHPHAAGFEGLVTRVSRLSPR